MYRGAPVKHYAVPEQTRAAPIERPFRTNCGPGSGSRGHFERPSGAERAQAATSSVPAAPRRLEVAKVGRCGVFEAEPSQVNHSTGSTIYTPQIHTPAHICLTIHQVSYFVPPTMIFEISCMVSMQDLGRLIEIANEEKSETCQLIRDAKGV